MPLLSLTAQSQFFHVRRCSGVWSRAAFVVTSISLWSTSVCHYTELLFSNFVWYVSDDDERLVCGDSKFDVKKYPTCLRSLCGGVGFGRVSIFNRKHYCTIGWWRLDKSRTRQHAIIAVRFCHDTRILL